MTLRASDLLAARAATNWRFFFTTSRAMEGPRRGRKIRHAINQPSSLEGRTSHLGEHQASRSTPDHGTSIEILGTPTPPCTANCQTGRPATTPWRLKFVHHPPGTPSTGDPPCPVITKIVATSRPAHPDSHPERLVQSVSTSCAQLLPRHRGRPHPTRASANRRRSALLMGVRSASRLTCKGPKIRVGKFEEGRKMMPSASLSSSTACNSLAGNVQQVGRLTKDLPRDDVKPGDVLLFDDPASRWTSKRGDGMKSHAASKAGGELSNNKGISRQGGGPLPRRPHRQDKGRHQDRRPDRGRFVRHLFPKALTDMYMVRQAAAGGRQRRLAGSPASNATGGLRDQPHPLIRRHHDVRGDLAVATAKLPCRPCRNA